MIVIAVIVSRSFSGGHLSKMMLQIRRLYGHGHSLKTTDKILHVIE